MSLQEKREALARVTEVQWGKRKLLAELRIPRSAYYRWRAQQLQGQLDIATALLHEYQTVRVALIFHRRNQATR